MKYKDLDNVFCHLMSFIKFFVWNIEKEREELKMHFSCDSMIADISVYEEQNHRVQSCVCYNAAEIT